MPSYQLFSLPNCDKCHEVKKFLGEIDILYEEFNLGMPVGKRVWGPILVGGYVPKTDGHGYIMPILVKRGADSKVEAIAQGPEDIKALFG
jgi:hypothetical protein